MSVKTINKIIILASLMAADRFPTLNYEDIAVGADGALYALENGLI